MQQTKEVEYRTPRGHIRALDGVRGFAAATVFLYHYGGGSKSGFLPLKIFGTVLHFGWAGVSLFFALSGFLISGILWDGFTKPDWWKRFYIRRSLRIFPLYYLALAIAAVVWLAQGFHWQTIAPLGYYALYLGNFPPVAGALSHLPQTMHLGHFWSLAVEEQFYIFWPFVLAMVAGRRRTAMRLILGLWALSLIFRFTMNALPVSMEWQTNFLLGRAGELLTGAYLALLVRGEEAEQRTLFRALPAISFVSALVLVGICFLSHGPELLPPWMSTVGLAFCSIFFASIVGLALRPGLVQRFFEMPLLRWLGKISYGIYVYHLLLQKLFVWIVDKAAPTASYNTHLILVLCVATAGTLIVASLSFYTFENFFLKLKGRVAH